MTIGEQELVNKISALDTLCNLSFHYYFNESKSFCKDYDDAIKFRFMSTSQNSKLASQPASQLASKEVSFAMIVIVCTS